MTEHIVESKLVAKRHGRFTNLVFQLISNPNEYVMCTIMPNWNIPEINIDDVGFLQYIIVFPGDEYLDIETGEVRNYRYRQNYLVNFILSPKIKLKQQELIL